MTLNSLGNDLTHTPKSRCPSLPNDFQEQYVVVSLHRHYASWRTYNYLKLNINHVTSIVHREDGYQYMQLGGGKSLLVKRSQSTPPFVRKAPAWTSLCGGRGGLAFRIGSRRFSSSFDWVNSNISRACGS